jgi:hypothetical protein
MFVHVRMLRSMQLCARIGTRIAARIQKLRLVEVSAPGKIIAPINLLQHFAVELGECFNWKTCSSIP